MSGFLFLLLLLGVGAASGVGSDRTAGGDRRGSGSPGTRLLLVAEGSPRRQERALDAIRALQAALGPRNDFRVVWFDADTGKAASLEVAGANLVAMRPKTPMIDALAAGLAELERAGGERALVIVAGEQFYPTDITERQLIEAAQRSEVRMHAMSLADGTGEKRNLVRRIGRSVAGGVFWLAEAMLRNEGRSHAPGETARLLARLAEATGGRVCAVVEDGSAASCAAAIAAGVASAPPAEAP